MSNPTAEQKLRAYEAALRAGFKFAYGRACFRTLNGIPMGMPVKAERVVRKALLVMGPAR